MQCCPNNDPHKNVDRTFSHTPIVKSYGSQLCQLLGPPQEYSLVYNHINFRNYYNMQKYIKHLADKLTVPTQEKIDAT